MVMAQELFSDLIASQPTNPFISMLKKAAIVFNELSGELEVSSKQTAITAIPTSNGSQILTEAETHVYDSVNLETWKELEQNQTAEKSRLRSRFLRKR